MKTIVYLLFFLIAIFLYDCSHTGNQPNGKTDTVNKKVASIDCPLMKNGVMDTQNMRPFAEVEKYIEFLERKDREIWQKPGDVISAMKLKGNETLADVGAGSGYFSFRFDSVLTKGEVIAIDIEPEMIRHIHHKVMASGIKNMNVILASKDDPEVPAKVDIVFICDVLHHIKNRSAWLAKLNSEMEKGAKLVLIEFKEGKLPQGPPENIKISGKEMVSLVSNAGFTLVKENKTLLPYQNYFEFEKK